MLRGAESPLELFKREITSLTHVIVCPTSKRIEIDRFALVAHQREFGTFVMSDVSRF